MNKIKEALASFRVYLGRDTEGLRRLDVIAGISNEMRKEIVILKEAVQRAKASLDQAVETERKSCDSVRDLRQGMELESRKLLKAERELKSARDDIKRLQAEIDSLVPADIPDIPQEFSNLCAESPLLRDARQFSAMFNHVRRDMRVAPPHVQLLKKFPPYAYEITDIIGSYSADDILRLGRFVTVLALSNFPGIIVAQENFATSKQARIRNILESDGGPIAKFVSWFRSSIEDPDRKGMTTKRTSTSGRDKNGLWRTT